MKEIVIVLIFFLSIHGVQAQDHLLLKGQTRDTTMAPIAFANVMAVDTTTKEMKAFAVTDIRGNFQLRLEKGVVYELQVTYVGFVPTRQYLQLNEPPRDPIMLLMKEAVNALDEVTVVAEMPVVVRGDTISYRAESFMKGDERKLEDVLAELPGFEIKENGDIEVQGKRVDKVLVDGKEFFEGDTKLATKNIPADVVDRVQVLQNFNDIAPMQGLSDDDRLAINIELKGDKKQMVFGDIEAGGGPESRYFGHANAFYYSPKTSINFIGDGNNVGELALSMSDYFRMTGGLSSLARRNGTTIRVNSGDAGIPLTDRNSASDLKNQLGALNLTSRPSDKWQFSLFMIGFNNDISASSNSLRTYPRLNTQTQEELLTSSSMNNRSGLGRFAVKYTPNYNMQIDYSFFGKGSAIDQRTDRNSQLLTGSNQLQESMGREPQTLNHQLRMFSALNERNIISAEVNYNEEKINSTQALNGQQGLFSNYLTSAAPILGLDQDQEIRSKRFDGAFNYYYILNRTTHVNVAFGINLSRQTLISQLRDGQIDLVAIDQELDITNRYARLQYKKKWDRLTISPGVSLNSYALQQTSESRQMTQYLFPQFNTVYEFGRSHDLEVTYRQSIEYNEISAYSIGYRLDRYNTLLQGNSGLSPAIYHSVNMRYTNYNTYNFFNIHGGLNLQFIKDGFTNNQEINGVENVLTTINAPTANRIISGYLNLEKRLNHFRVSGSVELTQSVLNNQIQGQVLENDNFNQQYQLNTSARLFKKLSIRAGYGVSINQYTSGELTSKFVNYRPNIGTTLQLKGWRLESEYAFNNYQNKSQNQETSFDMLDASLSYRKPKSPWEFKVQGLNLLDTRAVRRDSFSNNLISTYAYAIQQRYGLLTIKYDL